MSQIRLKVKEASKTILASCLVFGDLPELIIEIGQLLTLFFFKIW
jgi:hypothetical protein